MCCYDDRHCQWLYSPDAVTLGSAVPETCQSSRVFYTLHKCSRCCGKPVTGDKSVTHTDDTPHHDTVTHSDDTPDDYVSGTFDSGDTPDDVSGLYSGGRQPSDIYVEEHLSLLQSRQCSRLMLESQQSLSDQWSLQRHIALVTSPSVPHAKLFSDVGCASNKSLHFYSIDAQNHWMFADRLSVNLTWPFVTTASVLFDKANEENHVMQQNLTIKNTMSFILNFETGRLGRQVQSHKFEFGKVCTAEGKTCVTELDAHSFVEATHQYDQVITTISLNPLNPDFPSLRFPSTWAHW